MPRSRERASIHPFPHSSSWSSGFKHRDNCTLPYPESWKYSEAPGKWPLPGLRSSYKELISHVCKPMKGKESLNINSSPSREEDFQLSSSLHQQNKNRSSKLLVLVSTDISGSESRGTHENMSLSHESMSRATLFNRPRRTNRLLSFLCILMITSYDSEDIEPLPSNGRVFWFHYWYWGIHRQQGDHIRLLLFFRDNERRLNFTTSRVWYLRGERTKQLSALADVDDLHQTPRSRMMKLHLHSPACSHVVVLD
jgi:hypothetical protein